MNLAIGYFKRIELANKWQIACEHIDAEYCLIDLANSNWLENVSKCSPDILLLRPPGDIEINKRAFDEIVYIIANILNINIFPTYRECLLYENKRILSYFLAAHNIPHPDTKVFYSKLEAKAFVRSSNLPIVLKSSIGASGSGVSIAKTLDQADSLIERAFSKRGMSISVGPNTITGNILSWTKKLCVNPNILRNKFLEYKAIHENRPRGYIIVQEYIPHDHEWRVAKIGESYFCHKKGKYKDKCSGTTVIDYSYPSITLLEYIKQICDWQDLVSVAIDVFEYRGKYLINEIQAIFGHVQEHILEVNGQPGRYINIDGEWIFEKGYYNINESYDLRLKVAMDMYRDIVL